MENYHVSRNKDYVSIANELIEIFRKKGLTFEDAYSVIEKLKEGLEYLKNKAKI